jgi:poly(3-hydroxybutyrate) depolymerase
MLRATVTCPMQHRSPMVAVLVVAVVICSAPRRRQADGRQENSASAARYQASGQFRFVDPGTNHPIVVWYCRAPSIGADTRVVFVMHGSESQTARQACDIASPYVQAHKVIVLAPQFAEEYYPGDAYMFGNMVDSGGRLLSRSAWAFRAIEELFDRVRAELGLSQSQYDIVGFSGGAQFVHRLALFAAEPRFRRAVVGSAVSIRARRWSHRPKDAACGIFARPRAVARRPGRHRQRARCCFDGPGKDTVCQRSAVLCCRTRRGCCDGCLTPLAASSHPRR